MDTRIIELRMAAQALPTSSREVQMSVKSEVLRLAEALDTQQVPVARFGSGSIAVMGTCEGNEDFLSGLAFKHTDPHPIGFREEVLMGITPEAAGCFLRFHFANAASAQVLIEELIEIRDDLAAKEESIGG